VNPDNPVEYDLAEPCQFAELCVQLGVKIMNLSAGSPYYNPHIQRRRVSTIGRLPAAGRSSRRRGETDQRGASRGQHVKTLYRSALRLQPTETVQRFNGSTAQRRLSSAPRIPTFKNTPARDAFVVRNEWTDMIGLGG